MPGLRLRDRDAIVTKEGLIFRVFGYAHPPNAYVCDTEYALAELFRSNNPKAFRSNGNRVFYKFFEDEGWKFIQKNFPQYLILHEMLGKKVTGVNHSDVLHVRKPEKELSKLIGTKSKDTLLAAMQWVMKLVTECSGLSVKDFGVFGSILHGFYHPKFSDIDLVIYGRKNAVSLLETLEELYGEKSSALKNEFETDESISGKRWRFKNLSQKEFVWHQRRKLIYALFNNEESRRVIKTEFEPVKNWEEITNEYDSKARIVPHGWVKMRARVMEDMDALFIPAVYGIEPLEVLHGIKDAAEARRVVSYVEEFRMQAHENETIYIKGNLEEVRNTRGSFYQIALTYCPRYYEQVLKVVSQQGSKPKP